MTRADALKEAQRRWGASFGAVKMPHWFDHLAGERLREYQVGEYGRDGFEIRGRSAHGWAEAFADADTKMREVRG